MSYFHFFNSFTVKESFALIVQIRRNPFCCSFSIGISSIASSLRLSYWMATPREGWEVLSFHGGSIMMMSKALCPKFIWLLIKVFQLKFLTSAQIGIAWLPTHDYFPTWREKYLWALPALSNKFVCSTLSFSLRWWTCWWVLSDHRGVYQGWNYHRKRCSSWSNPTHCHPYCSLFPAG